MHMRDYTRKEYNNKYFRKNINYLVRKHNISIKELEEVLNIGSSAMSRYCREDGNSPEPKIGLFINVAKYFSILIDDLIYVDLEKVQSEECITKEVKKEDTQKNTDLLCRALIEKTRDNTLIWYELYYDYDDDEIIAPGYEEDNINAPMIDAYKLLKEGSEFISEFMDDAYDISEISIYTASIKNDSMQVLIMKLPNDIDDDLADRYELYLVNYKNELIRFRASHEKEDNSNNVIYNDYVYKLLRNMYTYACNSRIEMIASECII